MNILLLLAMCFPMISQSINRIEEGDPECSRGTYRHGDYCYTFVGDEAKFDVAQRMCEMGGGNLAIIRNQASFQFLSAYYTRVAGFNYWIGLRELGSEDGWRYLSDNSTLVYQKWYPYQPDNYNNELHCAEISNYYYQHWSDASCALNLLYICQYEGTSRMCELTSTQFGNICFELSKERKTMMEASKECQRSGGKLAEIKSEKEQLFLEQVIRKENWWRNLTVEQIAAIRAWKGGAWVGGYQDMQTKVWKFIDESPITNNNFWSHGYPQKAVDQNLCLKLTSGWESAGCIDRLPYFCRYKVEPFVPSATTHEGQTTGDPSSNSFSAMTSIIIAFLALILLLLIAILVIIIRRKYKRRRASPQIAPRQLPVSRRNCNDTDGYVPPNEPVYLSPLPSCQSNDDYDYIT